MKIPSFLLCFTSPSSSSEFPYKGSSFGNLQAPENISLQEEGEALENLSNSPSDPSTPSEERSALVGILSKSFVGLSSLLTSKSSSRSSVSSNSLSVDNSYLVSEAKFVDKKGCSTWSPQFSNGKKRASYPHHLLSVPTRLPPGLSKVLSMGGRCIRMFLSRRFMQNLVLLLWVPVIFLLSVYFVWIFLQATGLSSPSQRSSWTDSSKHIRSREPLATERSGSIFSRWNIFGSGTKEGSFDGSSHGSSANGRPLPPYAFASLLCDDAMITPAQVLVHSLKRTGTLYPFVFLLLPSVTEAAEQSLVSLGAIAMRITALDYPFPVNAEKIAINKMCRYSKLHIWSRTEYKKVAFIDVDCLIVRNIDDIFQYPELSAVRDAGDTYNTGVFILEPNSHTYDQMMRTYGNSPSYNHGDQGFINWYFGNTTKTSLPVKYNTMVKNQEYAVWPWMKATAAVYHLTSETKPWSFYYTHHKLWKENFDPAIFYLWTREYRNVARILKTDVFADENLNSNQLDSTYQKSKWTNLNRASQTCDANGWSYSPAFLYTLTESFSIVITKFSSIQALASLLDSFKGAKLVHRIFVLWPFLGSRSKNIVPSVLRPFRYQHPPVEFVLQNFATVNNKFNPIQNLRTNSVFLMTAEDNGLTLADLQLAFYVWRDHAQSLVGFHPYKHVDIPFLVPSTHPEKPNTPSYSLLSSNGLFLHSEYLFVYTCLMPLPLHRAVDFSPSGFQDIVADFAFNLMVMGMTGSLPIAVLPAPLPKRSNKQPEAFYIGDGTETTLDFPSDNELSEANLFMASLFFSFDQYQLKVGQVPDTVASEEQTEVAVDRPEEDSADLMNRLQEIESSEMVDSDIVAKQSGLLYELATQYFFETPLSSSAVRRIKQGGPKSSLFQGSSFVSGRFDKIPFTKMSFKKWKKLEQQGLLDESIYRRERSPRKNASERTKSTNVPIENSLTVADVTLTMESKPPTIKETLPSNNVKDEEEEEATDKNDPLLQLVPYNPVEDNEETFEDNQTVRGPSTILRRESRKGSPLIA